MLKWNGKRGQEDGRDFMKVQHKDFNNGENIYLYR